VSERLRSGHDRLDAVLDGGLPAHSINLIAGLPGTGKTILAQQYLFRNASVERPGLYLSTVSEPFDKVLRYGQSLTFFDSEAIGSRIFYADLAGPLETRGLPGALEAFGELIAEHPPGLIVIDSFKPLAAYSTGAGNRETRVLRVLKLRGSAFQSGAHGYRISAEGLDVFPRLADHGNGDGYTPATERQSTGVAALDAVVADGYWPGSTTLVAGPSGTGKTLLGLHFIFRGARAGEPGVVAGFQENPTQLERVANGFGWSLAEPGIELTYSSPVDVYLDEWVYRLLERIDATRARRVLVDSVTDLQQASRDEIRFREYLYSLAQRCARRGVSLLLTLELPDLFRIGALAEYGISHVADNVILLRYVADTTRLHRALTVIKTRASSHDLEIRDYTITAQGIVLGPPAGG
jgi:circadian clock protein KaiC